MRRTSTRPRLLVTTAAALLLLLAAGPALAYTIYLKDGQKIVAREKHKVVDGKAIITLVNGTQSFIDASEIDVRRTEQANRTDYGGTAVVLEDSREVATPQRQAAADQQKKTLKDLIARKEAGPRDLPVARRETRESAAAATGKTLAGYQDFASRTRKPYTDVAVAGELQGFFRGQGIEDAQIYQGTAGDRPFVELTTNSEGSVFRALTVAANALVQARDRHAGRLAALELLLTTPSRERAGQFVLTPELAADLLARRIEISQFYVENVQF